MSFFLINWRLQAGRNACAYTMSTTPIVSYNIVTAVTSCLKRYVKFSGRACRSEYWYWTLVMCIIGWTLAILAGDPMNPNATWSAISNIFSLAILLPSLAVAVRRLHDTGRSGWNVLWNLLPIIGAIIVLVYLCQGSREANQYGEGPASPEA